MVMERLTTLMGSVVELGEYNNFKINEDVSIDILQFNDNTIIIGDGSSYNLWSIKAILKGFEMIYGLRVNFYKSNIYGINFSNWNLEVASSFLSCRAYTFPFKFLGIWVGISPRRLMLWKELISNIRTGLSSWTGRFLSLRGKAMLINSVMNSLSIYTLSFYKALSKVLKEIHSILRKFLWRGIEDKRYIH